jgi:hypothetical protein
VELLSSLRRYWILTCFLLFITLAGTAAALIELPTTYQSVSSVVFLAPKNVAKTYGGNPYLAFNSTLNQTADVVRYETMDVRTANSLAARGYPSSYLITDAPDTSGPVLVVTVTGKNKAEVERSLHGVTNEVSTKLNALQDGLTSSNKVTDVVITFTPKPTVLSSKKLRPLTLVIGVGLILTVAIPLIVDSALMRRRFRKEELLSREILPQEGQHQARQSNRDPVRPNRGPIRVGNNIMRSGNSAMPPGEPPNAGSQGQRVAGSRPGRERPPGWIAGKP